MRKIVIVLLLVLIDIFLYKYLINISEYLKPYEYKYQSSPLIYQKRTIILNNTDDFKFDDYFTVLEFNNFNYTYTFDEDNETVDIVLNNSKHYLYSYSLIEPLVITKTEYLYNESPSNQIQEDIIFDTHIYYSNDYYEFEIGTDLSNIIQIVQDDIECYTNVTCDYSKLNPYELGEYEIYFYNDYEKIIKRVKII